MTALHVMQSDAADPESGVRDSVKLAPHRGVPRCSHLTQMCNNSLNSMFWGDSYHQEDQMERRNRISFRSMEW